MDQRIAAVGADKDAALDRGDLNQAVQSREEERRLLEELATREREWKSSLEEINERIAQVRELKVDAIDQKDFKRAESIREQERRLLEERSLLWRGTT